MVKGKVLICKSTNFRKYFKDFQGFETDSSWYYKLENVIKSNIDPKFQRFLSQPVVNGESIEWYAKINKENSVELLYNLRGKDRDKFEHILNETIRHYNDVIASLKAQGKADESGYLEKSIKFVDDQFVYCYEDKVILGIWGIQLRQNVRESYGIAEIQHFVRVKDPGEVNEDSDEIEPISRPQEFFTVRFQPGDYGSIEMDDAEITKYSNETIHDEEIPSVNPIKGYKFTGWNTNPHNYEVSGHTVFQAQYETIPILPWYRRFQQWITKNSLLKWLFYGLLILSLLVLLYLLIRSCDDHHIAAIPYPIIDKPFVTNDPNSGKGGIYDPGNPYEPLPTPPSHNDILPPFQGIIDPIDTNNILLEPGYPPIIKNRLNILMDNEDKSILDLAKKFKEKFPGDDYRVVYYDDVVKRMQIVIPANERIQLHRELPDMFAPEYDLFVFNESILKGFYEPGDPAYADPEKSHHLKVIRAPQAWEITKGNPKLTVAIVDNGFNVNHPELRDKVVMPYNVWSHSSKVFPQPIDHGTHVAAIALATMDNDIGLCGIVPETAFMPVQVADQNGVITITSVLDGILYALYQGADVINISLGLSIPTPLSTNLQNELMNHFKEEERLMNKIMDISTRHNTPLVFAAGNDDILAGISPLNRPRHFIVVSATEQTREGYKKTEFSNFGSYSKVSAPGNNVYSATGEDGFSIMSGTSMAAPMVTGAVALMKSLDENLTIEQIGCILRETGLQVGGNVGKLLQIDKALLKVQTGDFKDCSLKPEKPSSGDVQVLLNWNNYNDLDLICIDPHGDAVWYKNPVIPSGGQLEIDMNVEEYDSKAPIENIFWPSGEAPSGTYDVYVRYYWKHEPYIENTEYKVIVKYDGKTDEFYGSIGISDEPVKICTFRVGGSSNATGSESSNVEDHRILLHRKRDLLQKEIIKIDRELKNINGN